jgi:hypothetical protein
MAPAIVMGSIGSATLNLTTLLVPKPGQRRFAGCAYVRCGQEQRLIRVATDDGKFKERNVGIEFNQGGGAPERRHAARSAVSLEASLRERGRSALKARIETLSRQGCSVSGYGFVHQGGHVWVKLPGLESLGGSIAWCHEQRAGIAFEQPLHPAVLARFVSGAGTVEGLAVGTLHPGIAIPLPANDELVTRRAQIMQGIGEADRSPLLQRKAKSSLGMTGFINRQVARQTNYRFEQRFADAISTGSAELTVEGRPAEVLNVSASGLRLAVELAGDIGDAVAVEFAGFETYPGRLVWRRDGEVGISLPQGTIELCDRT